MLGGSDNDIFPTLLSAERSYGQFKIVLVHTIKKAGDWKRSSTDS